TARTKALCALYGRQFQHRPGLAAPILLTPIPYAITLPATQLGHTIHCGHGRPRFVASRTTILPGRPCASLPSVGRRTIFFAVSYWRRVVDVLHCACRHVRPLHTLITSPRRGNTKPMAKKKATTKNAAATKKAAKPAAPKAI